jgi:hypothetical protein
VRSAGRICGRGGSVVPADWVGSSAIGDVGGDDEAEVAGEELGDAMEAVERRDAAIVKRRCDSVLRVCVITHPVVAFVSICTDLMSPTTPSQL